MIRRLALTLAVACLWFVAPSLASSRVDRPAAPAGLSSHLPDAETRVASGSGVNAGMDTARVVVHAGTGAVTGSGTHAAAGADTGTATVTIVHINDVYEITPVEGGKSGGLARVASVLASAEAGPSPVIATLGGDYLSPTVIGTARVNGEPIAGAQMVDVLNAVGIDWATFGNHEFDVTEAQFRARMKEARFTTVSTNVTDAAGRPFDGVPTSAVVTVEAGGRTLRIGLIGVTIDSTKKPWVTYRDPIEAARAELAKLKGRTDAIVALTHLPLGLDVDFVSALPEVDVALGGHEHENWQLRRGPRFTPIVKADANARSAAIVSLTFGAPGERAVVSSRLQVIDDTIADHPAVLPVVEKWVAIGNDAWRRDGFDPTRALAVTSEPLDGRESTVRNRPGALTTLIVSAVAREAGSPDVALFNGGSVRIDDVLAPGPVTEYDVIRVLPFGGRLVSASFQGALLSRVLETGQNNQGLGGYLHTLGATWADGAWQVGGKVIDPVAWYTVALPEFLLTGGEVNLGFLTRTNPQVRAVRELRDVRRAVIDELVRTYRAPKD